MSLSVLAVIDGGYDECLQEIAWRRVAPLAAMTHRTAALAMHCAPALFEQLSACGVTCRAGAGGVPDWSTVRELATFAGEIKADILYAHGAMAHVLCALTGPLLGLPVMAHALAPVTLADAQAYTLCESCLVVANDFARSQALAVGCRNVAVVATPARRAVTAPRRERGHVVGWAGTWLDTHGAAAFVRAASGVAQARRDVQFRMACPDAGSAVLAALATTPRSLAFAPLSFGADGFAAGIDVFVHTAPGDATHVTIVDAIASGLPVVATSAGGSAELCRVTRRLRLHRAGDEDALVRAIIAACDDTKVEMPRPMMTMDKAAADTLQLMQAFAPRAGRHETEHATTS